MQQQALAQTVQGLCTWTRCKLAKQVRAVGCLQCRALHNAGWMRGHSTQPCPACRPMAVLQASGCMRSASSAQRRRQAGCTGYAKELRQAWPGQQLLRGSNECGRMQGAFQAAANT